MQQVFVIVHLLAAAVWVGGSVALVFAGVPAIRVLEGEPRGRAMRELGLRWRPLDFYTTGQETLIKLVAESKSVEELITGFDQLAWPAAGSAGPWPPPGT